MSFSNLAHCVILYCSSSVAVAITQQKRQFLDSHRSVQETCHEHKAFQTPFNENELVPSYHGIMFDVAVLTDEIEVMSIEFDARIDKLTDTRVEVFTMNGNDYQDFLDDEDAWEKLADTKAIASADGQTLLIPENSFTPIKIKRGNRQSFYISMSGPWVDSFVHALDKIGEIQTRNKDMVMYVGVGLNSRFPVDGFDKTVDPQFSGVIKYRKVIDCDDDFTTTLVTITLITPQSENHVFLSRFGGFMDDVVESKLLTSLPFQDMVSVNDLTVSKDSETSNYQSKFDCPDDWETCPRNVIISTLTFKHSKALSSGKLQYEISRVADSLMIHLEKVSGATRMQYVGLRAIVSEFDMTIKGLPTNQAMSMRHQRYLADSLTRFFATSIGRRTDATKILETIIVDKEENTKIGTARIAGTVMATQAVYLPTENLAVELVDSVIQEQRVLLQDLRVGVSARSEDYTDDMEYFGEVSTITARFTVYIPAAGTLEDKRLPFNLEDLHFKPLFALPFFVCFCFGCCRIGRKSKKTDSATHFDGHAEPGTHPKSLRMIKHTFAFVAQPSTSLESNASGPSPGGPRREHSSRSLDAIPRQESLRSIRDRPRQNPFQVMRDITLKSEDLLNPPGDATKLQRQRSSPDLRRQNSFGCVHVPQNNNILCCPQRQESCMSVQGTRAKQRNSFRTSREIVLTGHWSVNSIGDSSKQRGRSLSDVGGPGMTLQRQGSSSSMKSLQRLYSSGSLHRQDLTKSLRTTSIESHHSSSSMNQPTSWHTLNSSFEQDTVIIMFD